ncbi:DNA mismatch repair protein Msh6 [Cristinia sonorae]|uniref:DNA mismatch repair protein n=1 Tax=Cristinia sonorae TaxID=1940300 RepID=A0A8K0XKS8_9AGAR|nr:DNA mismatch repair protein Msh6 [Cristinia sonorae]
MPPKLATKQSGDLKQKSLMSFFGKSSAQSATTPNAKGKPKPASSPEQSSKANSSSDVDVLCTPASKRPQASQSSMTVGSAKYSRSSDGGSVAETPPTSDPIDIDMLSAVEDEESTGKAGNSRNKPAARKRKIVIEDSDDEGQSVDMSAYKKGLSAYQPSPEPGTKSSGRSKKPRVCIPSDEEEEDFDGSRPSLNAFTQKLAKFKKPPAKNRSKKSKSADDDDDFIVPDDQEDSGDEDEPGPSRAPSRASHSSSRSSSRLSVHSHSSAPEEDDSDAEPAPKAKSHGKTRPALKKAESSKGGESSTSNLFLTAAEQRANQQKAEKKSTEDPFSFLLDVKDKDGVRPGEPGYDPRTLYIPPKAWKGFTPFEKQFWEIKQNHYDTVLFFQKGKFFELYEEDARIGHQVFDLKLTQRVKMSMVGVPEGSFTQWASRFLAKGYKVGRVEQAETALGMDMRLAADKGKSKAKGDTGDKIVRRVLNKVYTNGTLVDEALLLDEQAGHCVSIREDGEEDKDGSGAFGICVLDSSTSEFNMSSFEDDVCRTKMETMMRQLRPKEIIFTKGNLSVSTTRLLKAVLSDDCLWTTLRESEGMSYEKTLKELNKLYPAGDDDVEMDDNVHGLASNVPEAIRKMAGCKAAVEALGSMIWYLRTLNIDKDILSMKNFNVYDPMKKGEGLVLDGQTLAHIEVLLNNEGTEEGSLLKLLGRCSTPSGKRLFRIWLCMPLRIVADINARLDAVEDLLDHPTFEADFEALVKGLPDFERIVSRIHAKNCKVKDFLNVLNSFGRLSKGLSDLADKSESFKSKTILGLLRAAPDLRPNLKHVKAMFTQMENNADVLLPVDGQDEAYDTIQEEIVNLERELDNKLIKFEKQYKLKLQYWHSGIGSKEIYLVQTKAGEKGVPKEWTKSGGTKAFSRWVVPSLQPTIRSLKEARENRNTIIKAFMNRLFAEFDEDRGVWLRAVRVLSELDCLFSLAKASSSMPEPRCRPVFVEGDAAFVDFVELRHPALCVSSSLKNDFIPNDVKLGGDMAKIALLTGPNMGGKSTAMRMTAVGVIMAQLGMMVPAKQARLCPVDAILTRMGAYDNMFSNASTFKVELDECCKILRDATPRSLVILDELGRGTSTYDGMAIAAAVLHQLATHTLSLAFFATHYGSLTDDYSYHPNIRNMHMKTHVDDEKMELVFLYKLVEGVAASSFGTHVANLAGVPMGVIERADVISKDFARNFKEKIEGKKKSDKSSSLPLVVQADFAYLFKLATGAATLPEDPVRKRTVLRGLKGAVRSCLSQVKAV